MNSFLTTKIKVKTKDDLFDDGNAALAIGELEAAEAAYAAALALDENDAEIWHALAMVRYKRGAYPASIEAGRRAVTLDVNNQLAWTSLSLAHMKNGQIPEAEAAAAKAKVISWGGKVKLE